MSMHSARRLGRIVPTLINASQVMRDPHSQRVNTLCGYCSELGKMFKASKSNRIFVSKSSSRPILLSVPLLVADTTLSTLRLMRPSPVSSKKTGSSFLNNQMFSKLPIARQYHTSLSLGAGHNKWSKIKNRKAVADKERSKVIGRFSGLIMTAIKIGGSDPDTNMRLENALSRAKQAGVPKATIENAICSATAKRSPSAEFFVYDARGPSGYHLLIEVLTDNKRKTRPEIRNLLSKHGGVLGEPGSASFVFEHKGVVCIAKSELKSDADPLELAIDVGAEDIIEDSDIDEDLNDEDDTGENGGVKEENREGQQEVGVVSEEEYIQLKCEPTELNSVSKAVKSKGLSLASASLEYLPTSYVSLEKGPYEKAVHLVELLNEHDDVVEVYDNFVVDKNESA